MTYLPMFPPPLGAKRLLPFDAAAAAAKDGHPLADLIQLRQEAADLVEWLLAFLDATDAPDDFEPSHGRCPDLNEIDEAELDTADDEPSLGAPERHPSPSLYPTGTELNGGLDQTYAWAQGVDDDREDQCEGEGEQCDDEGELPDSGIGDEEGLLEQLSALPNCPHGSMGRFE